MIKNLEQAAVASGRRAVPQAPRPDKPATSNVRADRKRPLLQNSSGIDADEQFGDDERLLNDFIKKHPMLSTEASSVSTMQMLAEIASKTTIPIHDVPCISKTHDDLFLSEPNLAIGERACACEQKCLTRFIARVRYGADTDKGFVCKEFLTPEEHQRFLAGGGLPDQRRKCVVCFRYYTTYIYQLARSDAGLLKSGYAVHVSGHSNLFNPDLPPHEDVMRALNEIPRLSSPVSVAEGYAQHACLFVDGEFANRRTQREHRVGSLLFRPTVRFSSKHYRYGRLDDGRRCVVQVGIAANESCADPLFRQPPPPTLPGGEAARRPRSESGPSESA
jgi:hypothetical protein